VILFLQNLARSVIPRIAVRVSSSVSFAVRYLLGSSINTLTLFGCRRFGPGVLPLELVVDDAIVRGREH